LASKTKQPRRRRPTALYIMAGLVLLVAAGVGFYVLSSGGQQTTGPKPIIIYVNQGNGIVNGSNFETMTSFATSHGFNTVFFQVYRQGSLLFTSSQLASFVNESHAAGLKIFFALYITNSSQDLPTSIYVLSEDGISLDMSTLPLSGQQDILSTLQGSYHGQIAVTTTDMSSPLKPDLLILETYGAGLQQYIRHGIIASVGVFATTSKQDYESQFQYALQNSDGVMVFDYAGLLKSGY
jgi:hypothetical protein